MIRIKAIENLFAQIKKMHFRISLKGYDIFVEKYYFTEQYNYSLKIIKRYFSCNALYNRFCKYFQIYLIVFDRNFHKGKVTNIVKNNGKCLLSLRIDHIKMILILWRKLFCSCITVVIHLQFSDIFIDIL